MGVRSTGHRWRIVAAAATAVVAAAVLVTVPAPGASAASRASVPAAPAAPAAPTLSARAASTVSAPAGSGAFGPARHSPCVDGRAVRRALDRLTAGDGLAGAAAEVESPGCGTWTAAGGVADVRTGRPMEPGGHIRIGSTTKTFTATVVLQLVAEHRLLLDATVDRYLPGLIAGGGYDGRRITVRELLQHTSGLPDHMSAVDWDRLGPLQHHVFTPRELVAMALRLPPPPRGWSYSTTNFVLLGMIVQKVTGHSPQSEVTRRIIRPLGLHGTYWPGAAQTIAGPHPRAYELARAGGATTLRDVTDSNMTLGGAGGALVSTLADENRFFGALLGGRLLPPAQLAQMRTTVAADADQVWPGARYGLGLISTPLRCGGSYWGHGGTTLGFDTAGGVAPDGRRVQLVLNQNVADQQTFDDELAFVQTALCAGR